MAKVFGKCEICLVNHAVEIWFPFRSENQFSKDREDLEAEDSVELCRDCNKMVCKIKRSDGEAFAECITIQDVCQVVRKALRL